MDENNVVVNLGTEQSSGSGRGRGSLRKKESRIKIEPRYVFVVLLITCAALLVLSYRNADAVAPVKGAVGDVVTPMQSGINAVGRFFSDKLKYFRDMDELLSENERLTEELDTLGYENKLLLQGRYELDDFRALYNLDQTYADYPKVAARVIFNNTDGWYNSFKIDKGSDDGIKPGMNVMAGNGLVGLITEVGHNNSTVRAIIDDASNVSGMFIDTSDTCMVGGNLKLLDEGYIEVYDIKKGAEVKEGNEVVTSYISTTYHPGILIGYVTGVELDSSNMTMSGRLVPAVDFSKLDMVLIITKEKEELY